MTLLFYNYICFRSVDRSQTALTLGLPKPFRKPGFRIEVSRRITYFGTAIHPLTQIRCRTTRPFRALSEAKQGRAACMKIILFVVDGSSDLHFQVHAPIEACRRTYRFPDHVRSQ